MPDLLGLSRAVRAPETAPGSARSQRAILDGLATAGRPGHPWDDHPLRTDRGQSRPAWKRHSGPARDGWSRRQPEGPCHARHAVDAYVLRTTSTRSPRRNRVVQRAGELREAWLDRTTAHRGDVEVVLSMPSHVRLCRGMRCPLADGERAGPALPAVDGRIAAGGAPRPPSRRLSASTTADPVAVAQRPDAVSRRYAPRPYVIRSTTDTRTSTSGTPGTLPPRRRHRRGTSRSAAGLTHLGNHVRRPSSSSVSATEDLLHAIEVDDATTMEDYLTVLLGLVRRPTRPPWAASGSWRSARRPNGPCSRPGYRPPRGPPESISVRTP